MLFAGSASPVRAQAMMERLESRVLLSNNPQSSTSLAVPLDVTATAVSTNRIDVQWVDTSTNEQGFKIERTIDGVSFVQIATVGSNVTSYPDSSLDSGTWYGYRVRAYAKKQHSGYSEMAIALTHLERPTGLTVSSFDRSHTLTLSWNDVRNEHSYQVQRFETGAWKTVGSTPANVTTFQDHGLPENTTHRYRVQAFSPWDQSPVSNEAQGTTGAFRLFEGTLFNDRPSPLGPGVETLYVAYEHYFYDWKGNFGKTKTREIAKEAWSKRQILVIDIESLPLDIRHHPKAVVDESIATFNEILGWIRQATPELKLGIYGILPLTPPARLNDPGLMQSWRAANDYVLHNLAPMDYIFPSIYRATGELSEWEVPSSAKLTEAQRFGKPVYPFILMQYKNSAALQPGGEFRAQLAVSRQLADGAIMWGGSRLNWDPSAEWWTATQAFLDETPEMPSAPTGLAINPIGARLSWNALGGDASGVIVERSSDGVNFTKIAILGRDQTAWADSYLMSGALLHYRIRAISGFGHSEPSNTVSAVVSRYAHMINQAESFEGARRPDTRFNLGVSVGNNDWMLYRDVDFNSGANQVEISIQVPPQNVGKRMQVRLGGLTSPIIGDYTLAVTRGWGDLVRQTFAITPTSGVHDVYVVFSNATVNSGFDWLRFHQDAPPAAPTRLTTQSTGGKVAMNWNDNSGDEDGFTVWRAVAGEDPQAIAHLPPDSKSYIDTTVGEGRYTYWVTATNAHGDSDRSNPDGGTGSTRDAYSRIEAESFDATRGGIIWNNAVRNLHNGNFLRYYGVDFGSGAGKFIVSLGVPDTHAGQYIDVRLDSAEGLTVGTLQTTATGKCRTAGRHTTSCDAWTNYQLMETTVSGVSGIHDLYLVIRGTFGAGIFDWFTFEPAQTTTSATVVQPPSKAILKPEKKASELLEETSD